MFRMKVMLDGATLFYTEWDPLSMVTQAAEVIQAGCPKLYITIIEKDVVETSRPFKSSKKYKLDAPRQSKLLRIDHISSGDGLDEETIRKLLMVQLSGQYVQIDCEAADGYFDVTLPDGTEVAALSACHLAIFQG